MRIMSAMARQASSSTNQQHVKKHLCDLCSQNKQQAVRVDRKRNLLEAFQETHCTQQDLQAQLADEILSGDDSSSLSDDDSESEDEDVAAAVPAAPVLAAALVVAADAVGVLGTISSSSDETASSDFSSEKES